LRRVGDFFAFFPQNFDETAVGPLIFAARTGIFKKTNIAENRAARRRLEKSTASRKIGRFLKNFEFGNERLRI